MEADPVLFDPVPIGIKHLFQQPGKRGHHRGCEFAVEPQRLFGDVNHARQFRFRGFDVVQARAHLNRLFDRLESGLHSVLEKQRLLLAGDSRRLDAVSPLRVLERGYAVVVNARDGRAVTDAAGVEVGDELDIRLRRGRLRARTTGRETQ